MLIIGACFVGWLNFSTIVTAEVNEETNTTPAVGEFDGSNSFSVASDRSLVLASAGTIEFWVVPDWKGSLAYAPVILSNSGPSGAQYTIAISGKKDGLYLYAADQVGAIGYDFSDEQLHHVALVNLTDTTAVLIDGEYAGDLNFTFADLPTDTIWVGSLDGTNWPFVGALAGLRIWSTGLKPEELVTYALKSAETATPQHPSIEDLVAVANFNNATLRILQPGVDDELPATKLNTNIE